MKIGVIKKLAENLSMDELRAAEEALYNDSTTPTHIDGDDEGEQLTHVLAAIFIQEYVEENNSDIKTALREYAIKVRTSIS
ncbi:hypothetical protein OAP07_02570 [Bacteroidia bacterium]|nr:hypothetical protein [Bacteroidia bacterium]MDC0560940.1 hypothetical protein [Bacteroidia bacterium]